MTLEDLFTCIQKNNIPDDLIIFKNPKSNDFISSQYTAEIIRQHNLIRENVTSINEIKVFSSVFDTLVEPTLQVYKTDKFDSIDPMLLNAKNTIISCYTITAEAKKVFKNYIVEIPELTDWQLKDYINTQLNGMQQENLDAIMNICNKDIYRIQVETDRLKIFPENIRDIMFTKFKNDLIYGDLTTNTIFDFINAIITKNIAKTITLYKDLTNIDSSPLGIFSLLYSNFRNIILVQLNNAVTAEDIGLSQGQFYAIKHNIGYYTKNQLKNIFLFLTDIDRKIKTGEIDTNMLLDYLLVNIFTT